MVASARLFSWRMVRVSMMVSLSRRAESSSRSMKKTVIAPISRSWWLSDIMKRQLRGRRSTSRKSRMAGKIDERVVTAPAAMPATRKVNRSWWSRDSGGNRNRLAAAQVIADRVALSRAWFHQWATCSTVGSLRVNCRYCQSRTRETRDTSDSQPRMALWLVTSQIR